MKLELFHAALLYIKFALGVGTVRYERALLHCKLVPQNSIKTLLRGGLGAWVHLAAGLELFHTALLCIKFALGVGAARYERALLHCKIVPQCSIKPLLRGGLGDGGDLPVELELFHAALLLLELLLFQGPGFEVLFRGLGFILFRGLGSPVSGSRVQGCSCFGVSGLNKFGVEGLFGG